MQHDWTNSMSAWTPKFVTMFPADSFYPIFLPGRKPRGHQRDFPEYCNCNRWTVFGPESWCFDTCRVHKRLDGHRWGRTCDGVQGAIPVIQMSSAWYWSLETGWWHVQTSNLGSSHASCLLFCDWDSSRSKGLFSWSNLCCAIAWWRRQ